MKNGNSVITMPIVLAFSIISLLTIGMLLINILTPYILYEKMLSTSLKYMFALEEFGYLTQTDMQKIIDDLVSQGFNKNKISLDATSEAQEYGEEVYLEIKYEHEMNLPIMQENTMLVNNEKDSTILRVKKYGISKR